MSAAESLFVVSQSSEPYSILLIDPETGSSKWSFRGNELQSSKIHYAVFLGEEQTHLCIALSDKPIIISIPMKEQKGNAFCTKSILHLNPNLLVSHPTGDFIFITAENKLFTWELMNGQMLSIVEEHARSITVLKISTCGNYLATASKDGAVKIFLTANLITPHGEFVHIQPIGGHNFHTLQINDIFISNGMNPRILSVSDDHSAILYSLATQEILLKLKTNQPLTSCCMDPAETRIFISSQTGGIRIIDIQTEFKSSYHRMKENENPAEHGGATFKGKFENHECAITNLSVNGDGTRLASGDRDGVYCIWDVSNGQCIRSGKMSGPIASLNFIQNCLLKQNEENRGVHIPLVSSLQKQISAQRRTKVNKHVENSARNDINLRALCNSFLEKINNGQLTKPKNGEMRDNEDEEEASKYKKRRFLDDEPSTTTSTGDAQQTEESIWLKERLANVERELERVMQINTEIYEYVAKSFVGEETN